MNESKKRLKLVLQRIEKACSDCGRAPGDVFLLAVSKRHSVEKIISLNKLGVFAFGENHLQGASIKQQLQKTLAAHNDTSEGANQ